MKIYRCKHCGNMVLVLNDAGPVPVCCGEPMEELKANTTDGAHEKHVPAVTVDGNTVTVTVGSVEHPMLDAHYIQWIILETGQGIQQKALKPGDKPTAVFVLADGDVPKAAYEYCNLHGFWKADI